jgi:D-alanine-D-alanine ligase
MSPACTTIGTCQQRSPSVALEAFRALGCAGMARVDMFLTPKDKVLVGEMNTLPGFTSISMYSKRWHASGLGYTELIARLIELAQERYVWDRGLKTSVV